MQAGKASSRFGARRSNQPTIIQSRAGTVRCSPWWAPPIGDQTVDASSSKGARALTFVLGRASFVTRSLGGFLVEGRLRATRPTPRCWFCDRDLPAAAQGSLARSCGVDRGSALVWSPSGLFRTPLVRMAAVEHEHGGFPLCTAEFCSCRFGRETSHGHRDRPEEADSGDQPPLEASGIRGSVGSLGKPGRRRIVRWFEHIQGCCSVYVRQLGDGDIAEGWAQVGAGFRSCPV